MWILSDNSNHHNIYWSTCSLPDTLLRTFHTLIHLILIQLCEVGTVISSISQLRRTNKGKVTHPEHPANKVIGPDFKPRRAVPKPTFLNTNPHCLSVLNLLSHLPGEPGFITLSGRSHIIPHPTLQEPLGYFCTLYKTDLLFDSLHKMLVFGSLTTPDFNLCFPLAFV